MSRLLTEDNTRVKLICGIIAGPDVGQGGSLNSTLVYDMQTGVLIYAYTNSSSLSDGTNRTYEYEIKQQDNLPNVTISSDTSNLSSAATSVSSVSSQLSSNTHSTPSSMDNLTTTGSKTSFMSLDLFFGIIILFSKRKRK